jgi:N-acyl-L-homoserine lactone synthetase
MFMEFIAGVSDCLPAAVHSSVARYRYKVFVETLGWKLNARDELELDQFDRADTVYVVARDRSGEIQGCARLLPTTRPYLLGDVFPQLLNGQPVPCAPDVWELSRFAAVDFNKQTSNALGQMSSEIAVRLLQESIACAAAHGARRLIAVSSIGTERLLCKAGFHVHRAGPPTIVDGHALFAFWIEIDQ